MRRELLLSITLLISSVYGADMPLPVLVDGREVPLATFDDGNAALYYLQAAMVLREQNNEGRRILDEWTDKRTPPPDSAEQAGATYLEYLHLGAAMPRSSFAMLPLVSWTGFETSLPMLSQARPLARLSMARAEWRFRHDRTAEAVDDIHDTLVFTRHLAEGGGMSAYLQGISMHASAWSTLARNLPRCNAAVRARLAVMLRSDRVAMPSCGENILAVEMASIRRTYEQLRADPSQADQLLDHFPLTYDSSSSAAVERQKRKTKLMADLALSPEQYRTMESEITAFWMEWDAIRSAPITEYRARAEALNRREQDLSARSYLWRDNLSQLRFVITMQRTDSVRRETLLALCSLPEPADVDAVAGRETLRGVLTVTYPDSNQASIQASIMVPAEEAGRPPVEILTIGGWLEQRPPKEQTAPRGEPKPMLPATESNF